MDTTKVKPGDREGMIYDRVAGHTGYGGETKEKMWTNT